MWNFLSAFTTIRVWRDFVIKGSYSKLLSSSSFFVFKYSAVGLVLYKGKLSRIFPYLFIKEQKS